jgi:hypothetical protein
MAFLLERGTLRMALEEEVSSITTWLKLREIAIPVLAGEYETGLVLTVLKVGVFAV